MSKFNQTETPTPSLVNELLAIRAKGHLKSFKDLARGTRR